MSQLHGGGTIETFCPACGFAVRQTVARPVRHSQGPWYARFDAIRTLALPDTESRAGSGFRLTPLRLFALAAWLLMAIAVRALFVGYPSIEPIVFAQLYVTLFSFVMFWIMFVRTAINFSGKQILLLVIGAVTGIVLVVKLVKILNVVPAGWEPDYCADFSYPRGGVDFRLPPKTFRCISIPIVIGGWFAGWLLTYWLIRRWEQRADSR